MTEKTGPLVFDASPILVLYRKQNGWERVLDILGEATDNGFTHYISLVNLGEVYYMLLRDHGSEAALDGLERSRTFPIQVIRPTYDQMLQAGIFKAQGGISYADCYAAALAVERSVPILTGDPEFSIVESNGVKVEWLPPNR